MRTIIPLLIMIWINAGLLSGCVSSKEKVFGTEMPSMKTIHDQKFHKADNKLLIKPQRSIHAEVKVEQDEFHWLPNPTLHMYVFKHLTAAGHPVTGYTTFFRLYTQDHIAAPGEQAGWEVE